MAKIHDLFIVELAEVIKGYGNNPDVEDPFCLSEFYRFYELPNIAVSRENFEKMRPVEPERKRGRWIPVTHSHGGYECCQCHCYAPSYEDGVEWLSDFCPSCGANMKGNKEYE